MIKVVIFKDEIQPFGKQHSATYKMEEFCFKHNIDPTDIISVSMTNMDKSGHKTKILMVYNTK